MPTDPSRSSKSRNGRSSTTGFKSISLGFREEMFAEMQAIRSSIGESKSLDKNGIQALNDRRHVQLPDLRPGASSVRR